MKVLLDENLQHALRAHLAKHETSTVAYMGWGGLKNGELLKVAAEAGFDVFVTGDRSLEPERTLSPANTHDGGCQWLKLTQSNRPASAAEKTFLPGLLGQFGGMTKQSNGVPET